METNADIGCRSRQLLTDS